MKSKLSKRINAISAFLLIVVVSVCMAPIFVSAAERFIDNGDGTVTDTKTGLMWSARDNGFDIDYFGADIAADESTLAGYLNWRLPDKKELAEIYDATRKNKQGYGITDKIKLSECCQWSSYDSLGASSLIDFSNGKELWMFKSDTQQLRLLMVRNVKALEEDEGKKEK